MPEQTHTFIFGCFATNTRIVFVKSKTTIIFTNKNPIGFLKNQR